MYISLLVLKKKQQMPKNIEIIEIDKNKIDSFTPKINCN